MPFLLPPIDVSILLSTLTSVASVIFNYSLRLDNELSDKTPRGRHGLWTGLKHKLAAYKSFDETSRFNNNL